MLSRKTLVDALAITTALTGSVQPVVMSGLYGMKSLTVEANFTYGSGGTTVKVWIQTSLDGGTNWIDVINFAFTTASGRKVSTIGIDGTATAVVPTDAGLADDAIVDGILGDMIRAKITTTGTYADSTALTVSAVPKGA